MAEEELQRRKGGIGSGNMSTPSTTSSNASSSGYGYAPLYEALAQLSGGLDTSSLANLTAVNSSSSAGTANPYVSPTDTTGMTTEQIRTAAEQAATNNPLSFLGVDLGAAGIGTATSSILSGIVGGPVGLLLGALGSWGAKSLYRNELQNQQQENFFRLISQIPMDADLEGRAGSGRAPIIEDPVGVFAENSANGTPGSGNGIGSTQAANAAANEDPNDPLGAWIQQNVIAPQTSSSSSSSSSSSNPSNGSVGSGNTYSGSGAGNSAGPGSGYSGWSSSGSDSSSDSD